MDSISSSAGAGGNTVSNRLFFKQEKGSIGSDLFECLKLDILCDVVLIADDGKRIPAHRVVLYTASDYFKALFTTELKEHGQQEIPIKEVDSDALEKLVEYSYIGEISIVSETVGELLKAANMLRFVDVKDKCGEFYATNMTASNCLGIRYIADIHNMTQLESTAHEFAVDHFEEVSKGDEFLQLDADYMAALLKDEGINVTSEEEVFNTLVQWVKFDVENRRQSLGALIKCIRFKHISESFILKEVHQQCGEIQCPELFFVIIGERSSQDRNEIPRSSKEQLRCVRVTPPPTSTVKIVRYNGRENECSTLQRFFISVFLCMLLVISFSVLLRLIYLLIQMNFY